VNIGDRGVIELVPLVLDWVETVGYVVPSTCSSVVVADPVEIVDQRLRRPVEPLDERAEVEPVNGEIDRVSYFLLTLHLVEGVALWTSDRTGASSSLESLYLDDQNLRCIVELEFLQNVLVLLALWAVPLVDPSQFLLMIK